MIGTAGKWDPDGPRQMFFAAGQYNALPGTTFHDQWLSGANLFPRLVAVNDLIIGKDGECPELEHHLSVGSPVLLDSGIFWLTNQHKRSHGLSMDEALSLAPHEIDGFDELFDRYVKLTTRYGDDCWGYIELDQGGAVNKRITRARLHDLGLSPMPVYHPLNDGREYGEELFENFDRFCMGNVVQADPATRARLILDLWHLHRRYPKAWVHVLGYTPTGAALSSLYDSCDSSTWLHIVRWPEPKIRSLAGATSLPTSLTPPLGSNREEDDYRANSLTVAYLDMVCLTEALRDVASDLGDLLGLDQYATEVDSWLHG